MDTQTERHDLSELLSRVASRDRTAFVVVYQRSAAKLFGIALRILRQRELAEEAVQEAYLRIWRNAGRYDPAQASPIAWMAAITRNQAIDLTRRRAERISKASVDIDEPVFDRAAAEAFSQLSDNQLGGDPDRLRHCLEALPPDRRTMVVQAYCAGLSREELARDMAKPVNTVKTQLRRTLASLKRCLDGET